MSWLGVSAYAQMEDDESLLRALVDLLATFDYRPQGYASAEDFLASADAAGMDCIVSDIHMPGLSGIELMESLKTTHPNLPVILITARADRQVVEKISASSAFGLLVKPLDAGLLIDMIEAATKGAERS
jgi:FixJ family two-component response regulator